MFPNPIAKVIGTLVSLLLALPVSVGIGALEHLEVFAGESAVTIAELQDCTAEGFTRVIILLQAF